MSAVASRRGPPVVAPSAPIYVIASGKLFDVDPDERWFGELDYDVEYEVAEGWTWASLRRRSNPVAVVPRYGRGSTREEAAASARRRYEVEEIG